MRATGGSSRVMCDNVPGLVSRQRQLCHRHPDVMRAIGLGVAEWTAECQHQFRQHRWNCNTLDRDHGLFGRVLLRSKSLPPWSSTGCPLTWSSETLLIFSCTVLVRSFFYWVALSLFCRWQLREIKELASSFEGGWAWYRSTVSWLCALSIHVLSQPCLSLQDQSLSSGERRKQSQGSLDFFILSGTWIFQKI